MFMDDWQNSERYWMFYLKENVSLLGRCLGLRMDTSGNPIMVQVAVNEANAGVKILDVPWESIIYIEHV